MSKKTFTYRSLINASADKVFAWHEAPGAFDKLRPPWHWLKVVDRTGGIENGSRVTIMVYAGVMLIKWVLEHRDYIKGIQFKDVQIEGPFKSWAHSHLMEPNGADSCYLIDRVDYELPFGFQAMDPLLRIELKRLFEHRHSVVKQEMEEETK